MTIAPGMGFLRLQQLIDQTSRWLDKATKHGTWTEGDQKAFDFSYGRNWIIDLYKAKYDRENYMRKNNIDWGDVVQPWNLPGGSEYSFAGQFVHRGLNFVSDNVRKLYR